MNQVEKIVYNVKEIQVMLGIGRNKAYDLVNSNEFPVTRIDNRIIIPKKPFLILFVYIIDLIESCMFELEDVDKSLNKKLHYYLQIICV